VLKTKKKEEANNKQTTDIERETKKNMLNDNNERKEKTK
jgi:hypothetical protein